MGSAAPKGEQSPGFDRLLTQPRAAKIDIVAAWSVERLGRSLQDPRWSSWGAERSRMRSLLKRQAVDTTRPAGRALFQMLGVFAEFEREIIKHRSKHPGRIPHGCVFF